MFECMLMGAIYGRAPFDLLAAATSNIAPVHEATENSVKHCY